MTHRSLEILSPGRVEYQPLPHGEAGTLKTLKVMGGFARRAHRESETVRMKADVLTRGIAGHDFRGKAARLFIYVRDEIIYQRDPLMGDSVQDARYTMARGRGDCDDKCVLLAALLAAIGIRSRFVVATYNGRNWQHVYLAVQLPRRLRLVNAATGKVQADQNEWVFFDPTPERAPLGWEGASLKKFTYGIFGDEADQLGIIPQLIMAGISIGSSLLGSKKPKEPAMTDADIAASIDSYTQALLTDRTLDPESIWTKAHPAVVAPGGGQLTIAAAKTLWDLKEKLKAEKASGSTGSTGSTTAGGGSTAGGSTASGGLSATTLGLVALGAYVVLKG